MRVLLSRRAPYRHYCLIQHKSIATVDDRRTQGFLMKHKGTWVEVEWLLRNKSLHKSTKYLKELYVRQGEESCYVPIKAVDAYDMDLEAMFYVYETLDVLGAIPRGNIISKRKCTNRTLTLRNAIYNDLFVFNESMRKEVITFLNIPNFKLENIVGVARFPLRDIKESKN